jgi:hypothetical protein
MVYKLPHTADAPSFPHLKLFFMTASLKLSCSVEPSKHRKLGGLLLIKRQTFMPPLAARAACVCVLLPHQKTTATDVSQKCRKWSCPGEFELQYFIAMS